MKSAYLIGNSLEALELAHRLGWKLKAVVDPSINGNTIYDLPVILSDEELFAESRSNNELNVIIAIDSCNVRKTVFERCLKNGMKPTSLCRPNISSTTRIGIGAFIQDNAHVSVNCHLGRGIRINCLGNVMHDCNLEDFVTIAPNAVLLGGVTVGQGSYIGSAAVILPGRKVGKNAVIGAGAVVTKDVPDGVTVVGIPARSA